MIHPRDIYLSKMNVEPYLPDGEKHDVRWTLASWYEEYCGDELPFLPYYDHLVENPGQNIDNPDVIIAAHKWAERAIRETTDYLICGWYSLIAPALMLRKHRLEIHTTDGHIHFFSLSGSAVKKSLRHLANPNDTISFGGDPYDMDNCTITKETIIPVRHITLVNHTTEQISISR